MILMHLQGRLGNQMFQVFVTIAAALSTGQSFGVYTTAQGNDSDMYWNTVFSELRQNLLRPKIKVHVLYTEPDFKYRPFFDKLKTCYGQVCQINGYFQKYLYFEPFYNRIKDLLQLNEKRHAFLQTLRPRDWNRTICMHFRLGDYVKLQGTHPLMPYQYYRDALATVLGRHPDATNVMYFCEPGDVRKVQKKVSMLAPEFPGVTFEKVPDGLQDFEEMYVMSFCQHHIIANSTFSFWGAYLQDTDSPRTVCYPSLWFGPEFKLAIDYDTSMFPPTWTRVLCH
jgi:hypothetical protein